MSRLQPHILFGLFALVTLSLAGAALGQFIGLSASEGVYLTLLALALIGWLKGRPSHQSVDQP